MDKIQRMHAARVIEAGKHFRLHALISRSTGQLKLPFDTDDEKVYYVFFVLEHLLDATLKTAGTGGLSMEAVKDKFLQEYLRCTGRRLEDREAYETVRWILIKVLLNETQEISFTPAGLPESSHQHLIQYIRSIQSRERNGRDVTLYQVGMDGIRVMFAYKEYPENLRISAAGLLLKQQVESGEYEGAQHSLMDTVQNLQYIQTGINARCDSMRSNVLSVRQTETKDVYRQTIDAVKNAMVTYQEVQAIAAAREEQVQQGDRWEIQADPQIEERLQQLRAVGDMLIDTLTEMTRTVNIYEQYCRVRREAQLSQLAISARRGATIRKNIMEPLLHKPQAIEWLDLLLQRMFIRKPKKHLNPCRLLEFPQVQLAEETPEEIDELPEEESEEKILERERRKRILRYQIYASKELVDALLNAPSNAVTLREFAEKSRYLPLIHDLDGLKVFLTLWCAHQNIPFQNIEKQEQVIFDSEFTQFEPVHVLAACAQDHPAFRAFRGLVICPADGTVEMAVQEQGTLVSDNTLFRLVPTEL